MTKPNDPAFPESHPDCPSPGSGMTKREYFAAMALQGLLACPDIDALADQLAKASLEYADALIAALNKEPK